MAGGGVLRLREVDFIEARLSARPPLSAALTAYSMARTIRVAGVPFAAAGLDPLAGHAVHGRGRPHFPRPERQGIGRSLTSPRGAPGRDREGVGRRGPRAGFAWRVAAAARCGGSPGIG